MLIYFLYWSVFCCTNESLDYYSK